MEQINVRRHWGWAMIVLILDMLIVTAILGLQEHSPVKPPPPGEIDRCALIGWVGVLGSTFIFGSCCILIKAPSVQRVNCDCMVFQCYYSVGVVAVSFIIWFFASQDSEIDVARSSIAMGLIFGAGWILMAVCGVKAINSVGMAVGGAMWIGITILVSFIWSVAVFDAVPRNWPGVLFSLALMMVGVGLAALSSIQSERYQATLVKEGVECVALNVVGSNEEAVTAATPQRSFVSSNLLFGIVFVICVGVINGSLMVTLRCFGEGCPTINVPPYRGDLLAPLAFLPSIAIGLLISQPVLFLMYWGPSMVRGEMPQFHVYEVALPGFLTGVFWGMGNFTAMFATTYLGQTIGFPLTQTCLVVGGLWGIMYFREIQGHAIKTWVVATFFVLLGAALDGQWG